MALEEKKDYSELICDISEVSGLFEDSGSLNSFLQKTVGMIAEHMHCDVCSIYLYYESNQELVLMATKGLNAAFIGNVKLRLGEGLTGLALKELRPINERSASKNLNFRYFPGLGEERYESFLAVPIVRGKAMIGVLVIQNTKKNFFTDRDINTLRAISSQLANTIEMTRTLLSLEGRQRPKTRDPRAKELSFIKGKVGSSGYAHCEAVVVKDEAEFFRADGFETKAKYTLKDFHSALKKTEEQLEEIQKQVEEKLSDVASLIFSAQILMLKDQSFIDTIEGLIRKGVNPPEAIIKIVQKYSKKFESIEDAYIREKSHDILDIGKRLLQNLTGKENRSFDIKQKIVIARELFPSDALKLSSMSVKGIVVLRGGATSHLSILSRSLQIPLIIADVPELLDLQPGTKVLMDAEEGNVYINPSKDILQTFKEKEGSEALVRKLKKAVTPTTKTKDGTRVVLMANVNLLSDIISARDFKAEGVGLYRTEFPFIVRDNFPSEEEQYVIYKKLVEQMQGKETTFRTLDIGGDKVLSYFDHHLKEKNPYLGMRSIRFSLQHIDIFSQQIRAILRAGIDANMRIMFPMISSVDEFMAAKRVVSDCIEDLGKEKIPHNSKPKIGLMIELPAVMEVIEELAELADFFSIGTNDFIQYMLAVDRTNEKVADLYLPHHPSILRALKKVVDAADKYKIDVSICGDMGQEPKFMNYLLGIGIRKFSLNPTYIPRVQAAIKQIDIKEAKKETQLILSKSRLRDIAELLDKE